MRKLYLKKKLVLIYSSFPSTFKILVDQIVESLDVLGLIESPGVVSGEATPDSEDEVSPWLKYDSEGNAIDWFWHNGSAWVSVEQIGTIKAYNGSITTPPSGYKVCDGVGTYVDRLGSTVNIPDLRDRFIRGAGTAYSPDDTGGSDNSISFSIDLPSNTGKTALSLDQLPVHSHHIQTDEPHGGASEIIRGSSSSERTAEAQTEGVFGAKGAEHHHNLGGSASGTATVTPEYYALYYIIYTAT